MNQIDESNEESQRNNLIGESSNDLGKIESEEIVEAAAKADRPKRPNKTQRKYERYQRQVEKYRQKKKEKREKKKLEQQQKGEGSQTPLKNGNKEETLDDERRTKRTKVLQRERLVEIYGTNTDAYAKCLKVCIDCSFGDEHMSSKELARLAQQIGRCYAVNKALASPAHLSLCALDREAPLYAELCRKNEGFERYVLNVTSQSLEDYLAPSTTCQIAYLSPDSTNYLEQLDPNTVGV